MSQINKEDVVKDLEGDTFPEDLDDDDFNEDIREGLDVLIYSDVKHGRPWLGRIVKVTGPRVDDSSFSSSLTSRLNMQDMIV